MTAKQPREHCGHECVCKNYPIYISPYPAQPCNIYPKCQHDTRSRPAPAAPCNQEIRGFVMIDRQKDFSLWLQQHDATIHKEAYEQGKKDALLEKDNLQVSTVVGYEAGYEQGCKDEREKVLDEIIKLARCGKCPFPKKKAVVCESTNDFECISCLANSLRREEVRE